MFSSVIERVFIGHPFVSPSQNVLAVSLTITFVVSYSSLVSLVWFFYLVKWLGIVWRGERLLRDYKFKMGSVSSWEMIRPLQGLC